MTELEKAARQALEALESYHGYMEPLTTVFGGPRVPAEQSTTGKVEKAITALRQCLEQQPADEPHSWYSAEHDEWMTNKTRKEHEELNSYTYKVGGFDLALYTRPQPAAQEQQINALKNEAWNSGVCPVCNSKDEPKSPIVSRAEEAYESAKQRKWVGLTDEEAIDIGEQCQWYDGDCERFDSVQFARAIEAKLKEKNS